MILKIRRKNMKKFIIILIITILLAIIAYNTGKMFGRKVFEDEVNLSVETSESVEIDENKITTENVTEPEVTVTED